MKNKKIYEVVDYTGDTYHPLGVFPTHYQAMHEIRKLESPDSPISEFTFFDGYERIAVIERKIGWSANGKKVWEVEREEFYNEEQDTYYWRRVGEKPAPAFPEISSLNNK